MVTKKSSKKKSVAPKAKAVKKAAGKTKSKATSKPAKSRSAKLTKITKVIQPKKVALSVKKPLTKSQTVEHLSTVTGVKKKDVANLLEAIISLMEAHLSKKGPGEMNFAGIFKCRVIHKPATKARQGVNPFTGEPMTFSAKPARNVIKIRPLKKLKEVVG